MDDATKSKAGARLRRIGGQIAGIERMIEQDRYCVDVLLQIAAVRGALDQVGRLVLESHVRTCVSEALASGKSGEREEKIAELMEVFSRYAHIRPR